MSEPDDVVDLAEHYASRARPPQEPEPNPDALPPEEIERRWACPH